MKKVLNLILVLIVVMVTLVVVFGCGSSVQSITEGDTIKGEKSISTEVNESEETELIETVAETQQIEIEDNENHEENEEIVETALEKNRDMEKFLEIIKDYNINNKTLEYGLAEAEILGDWVSEEIDKEGVASRYMDLALQVSKDYFLSDYFIKTSIEDEGIEMTADIEKVIELINIWQEKTGRYFEYRSKYYYGDGAEYEIKSDEIRDEISDIESKYLELIPR